MKPVLNLQPEFNDAQEGKIIPQALAEAIAHKLHALVLTNPEEDELRKRFLDSYWEMSHDRELAVSWYVDFIQELYDNGGAWEVIPSFEDASKLPEAKPLLTKEASARLGIMSIHISVNN